MKRPIFDTTLCVSCGVCVQGCPVSAIELRERGGRGDTNLYPAVGEGCIGCGLCERGCPVSAVSMEER